MRNTIRSSALVLGLLAACSPPVGTQAVVPDTVTYAVQVEAPEPARVATEDSTPRARVRQPKRRPAPRVDKVRTAPREEVARNEVQVEHVGGAPTVNPGPTAINYWDDCLMAGFVVLAQCGS